MLAGGQTGSKVDGCSSKFLLSSRKGKGGDPVRIKLDLASGNAINPQTQLNRFRSSWTNPPKESPELILARDRKVVPRVESIRQTETGDVVIEQWGRARIDIAARSAELSERRL